MSLPTVTKAEIASKISTRLKIPMNKANELVESFIEQIIISLASGKDVKLSTFGNFVLHHKKARIGRNPKTGEEAMISARKSVSFQASMKLKQRVNSTK